MHAAGCLGFLPRTYSVDPDLMGLALPFYCSGTGVFLITLFANTQDYDHRRRHAIRWCTCTVNFFRGCEEISEGCDHCYAAAEGIHQTSLRPQSPYRRLVTLRKGHPRWAGLVEPTGIDAWTSPFRTRDPMLCFVNSMSDPFHKGVPDAQLLRFLRTLFRARWHTFLVLTKRAERLASVMTRVCLREGNLQLAEAPLPPEEQFEIPNVWLGVTAENQRRADERIPQLLGVKAAVRFVSVEPMIERIDLRPYLGGLHWLIVGGESAGPTRQFRDMDPGWAREVRDHCLAAKVPFFYKQGSGLDPSRLPKELDGQLWEELPRRALGTRPTEEERRMLVRWAEAEYQRYQPNSRGVPVEDQDLLTS